MFETAAPFETEDALLARHSGYSPALAQRLSVVILLLALALLTTSCGLVANASGTQSGPQDDLKLSGNLTAGTVFQPYNSVLTVSGGTSPYYFSVKTGVLPPGIRLNPATGTLSGTPSTAGKFSFEVIATDSPSPDQGSQAFAITVVGGSGGGITVGCVSDQHDSAFESDAAVHRHGKWNFEYRRDLVGDSRLGKCQWSLYRPSRQLAK